MKQIHKILLIVLISITITSIDISAQGPPPPPDGGHGQSGNQPGGNAPITGGLFILLGLGAAYGGRKLYDLKKEKLEK